MCSSGYQQLCYKLLFLHMPPPPPAPRVNMCVPFVQMCTGMCVNSMVDPEKLMMARLEKRRTPGEKAMIPCRLITLIIGILLLVLYMEAWLSNDKLKDLGCYTGTAQLAAYTKFTEWCLAFFIILFVVSMTRAATVCAAMHGKSDESDESEALDTELATGTDDSEALDTELATGMFPTQKKKMLPAPFNDWEQKKAVDGRAYYSNAKLRKTQWVHPATNTHQAGGRHQV